MRPSMHPEFALFERPLCRHVRSPTRRGRSALGAQPRRLLIGIFGRAAVPLLIGAIAGCAIALRLHSSLPIAEAGGRSIPGIVPASAALMIVVGLLAVAGPARRAIRIDPTEALRVS